MIKDNTELMSMLSIIVVVCIIVILAMTIDLISGLNKAKQRGEIRSSWGLKRTLNKFILYMGSLLIAGSIDVLLNLSHIYKLIDIEHLSSVPIVCCLVGIFQLIVEFLSVREAADEKTRTELSRVESLAAKIVTKEELINLLAQALQNKDKNKTEEDESTY